MQLDLETLYISSALGRGAYFVVFAIVALRRPGETCLWHWIGAILTSTIGSAIMSSIPPNRWLTFGEAWIVYLFFAASLTLSWSGLRLFNGRKISLVTVGCATLLPGTVYAATVLVGMPMRIALASIFALCGAYAAAGAYEAVRRSREQRLWSAYIVAASLGSYALMLLLTLGMLVATDLPMNTSESSMMSMILDQASGILIYFGYIAMANERAVLTIERLADTDPLTGLVNRRGLQAALAQLKPMVAPYGSSGVLLADIDHFKMINDTHGHQAGDAVLVAFASRVREALRVGDILARWGGEEFLAVLPQTEAGELAVVAERLRSSIESEPFTLPNGLAIRVTVSVGVSEMAPVIGHLEAATREADAALYEAKQNGRNQVSWAHRVSGPPIGVSAAA
ncbi:GGDEF domain-containing protein [Aureimonas pseudogalii]|uniref:diguanylate cyclase n=1 Tax=Aureimonas pseudogalii TaxID=1744844 RepID=A0A7W6H6P2_9HYPH|nr:GGDEF domain-containing protein [Aureimonas pseudogalii]MBB3999557.1 diguanylate cyclase (GGDEF)-like protein [Aureimonas pseudogalii]